jgi:hypothetical protein
MTSLVASELLPTEVLKPTATVHIANDFSFVERKIINVIMADFQTHNLRSGEYELPLTRLCHDINYASRNREPLKQALETLVTTAVKWNIFERDKIVEWGVCTFLSSAKIIRGGKVRYRVNEQISSWIKNPTLFAKFYLLIQTRFSKKHSLILYEFFVDELSRKRTMEADLDAMPVNELRALLGIAKDQYEEFKIFNRAVLKPSIEEVNDSTDIDVRYDLQRRARKVAAVTFSLKRKSSYQLPLQMDLPMPEESEPLLKVKKIMPNGRLTAEQQATLNRLIKHGVAEKRGTKLVRNYDAGYIDAKIDQVEKEIAAGKKIRNRGGYLTDAITEDYQEGLLFTEALEQKERQEKEQQQTIDRKRKEQLKRLQPEWEKFRQDRARQAFMSLSPESQEKHRQAYIGAGGFNGAGETLFRQRGGWDNPIIMQEFTEKYLVKKLLAQPEETSIESYIEWRNVTGPVNISPGRAQR